MLRWRFGLYGVLLIFIALGVYWRLDRSPALEEPSFGERGGGSSPPSGAVSDGSQSRGTASFRSRAARRVQDSDHRLILATTDRATGAPIPGAEVRLYGIDSQSGVETEYGSAYANARGEAGFNPPPGSYVVTAHHRRYAELRESVELAAAGSVRKSLVMTPSIGVTGLVTDRQGRPRSQAAITFSSAHGTAADVYSGDDGSFEVWLQPGRYQVAASGADAETVMHGVEIWPRRVFFLEIMLGEISPSIAFSGKVEAAHGPVSDAIVQVRSERQPNLPSGQTKYRIGFFHSVETGTDGRFSLELPLMDAALLTIAAPGHETLRERVDLKSNSTKTFWLQDERGFHLKVIDRQGNVVPGVEIIGVNGEGRRVVRGKGRFVYSSSEYPFEIYAVERRSGRPITAKKLIQDYQPEIQLDSPIR